MDKVKLAPDRKLYIDLVQIKNRYVDLSESSPLIVSKIADEIIESMCECYHEVKNHHLEMTYALNMLHNSQDKTYTQVLVLNHFSILSEDETYKIFEMYDAMLTVLLLDSPKYM